MSVTHDAKARKQIPVYSGLLRYFPNALQAVADLSRVGNEQHNPGQPLHWAKEKSTDEQDALMRHLLDAGTRDTDGVRHSAKVAWRALAALEREIERDREAPGQVTETPEEELPPYRPFQTAPCIANAAAAHGCPETTGLYTGLYGERYGEADPVEQIGRCSQDPYGRC